MYEVSLGFGLKWLGSDSEVSGNQRNNAYQMMGTYRVAKDNC